MQVHEAQSSNQVGPKEDHTKTHIIKIPRVKDNERILQAAREKQLVTSGEFP